jgi:hypothetical protein
MYSKFIDDIHSLYSFDVTTVFPKECRVVFDDASRVVVIQVVVQLLFAMSTEGIISVELFMATLLYTIAGVAAYWLIFRRLVSFK